jgi:DNA-binding CsgD family transcriptional regulator
MRLSDYFDVSQSPDRQTFERRLVDFAHALDFGRVSAALVVDSPGRDSSFVMLGNTPQDYLAAAHDAEQSKRDPVLKRMKSQGIPFTYDQKTYIDDNAADLWEEQAVFGYRSGISMALHLPGGRHFLLGVDRDGELPADDAVLTRLMADLQLLAMHAQDAAVRLLLDEAQRRLGLPQLTQREQEVLRWTGEGKSSWEVGKILGMSEHTVNFHLRNLMTKLDVTSKHLAVLRALSLGLL